MISDLRFYAKLLSRRFPAMAALFLLSTCIGVIASMRLPTMYQTNATLLVESAQISDPLRRAGGEVNALEQLEVIRQRLLTRENVIDVARSNKVFPNQSSMNPDEIVSAMRSRTSVKLTSGRNKATLMTIGFKGPKPRQVAAVVNQYVTIVLATNSDFRTSRVEGATDFFDQEVETLSEDLDQQSEKIVRFKNENATALPENLEYRLGRQSLLQERLARAERDLEALISQRASIQKIYENTGSISVPGNAPRTPEHARLRALESELRVALSVYSEQNPKVKLLRNQIEVLTEQIQSLGLQSADAAGTPSAEVNALDVSLTELDARLDALRQETADTKTELARLQDSIDRTPATRIALEAMERDLRNIQNLYSAAVERQSQARMGERIELSAKGERITVLEPATAPNSPSSPNRPKIIAMGVAVGLGLAAGLFVLLELLNHSIRRPADIVNTLNITPLITIPRLETANHRRWRRVSQLATLAVIIVAVPASLWAVDTYYMPLDLLFEKIRDRLV